MRRVKKTLFPNDPTMDEISVLGTAVRASRTEAGVSLEEAAMTIGIAKQTLADLERGKPTVSLGIALKVAHAFGLTILVIRSSAKDMILSNSKGANNAT